MSSEGTRRSNGEGTTPRLRSDGRWFVEFKTLDDLGRTRRVSVYGKTRREVVTKAKEVRTRLAAGQPARDAKLTVTEVTERWLTATLAASERKPTTKATLTALARKNIQGSALGRIQLDRVKPTTVERWVVELRERGLASATVNKVWRLLSMIFDTAVRDGLLAKNPVAATAAPKVERVEAQFLTVEQADRLLTITKGTRHHPLFALMLATGVRPGEAMALTWQDVDTEQHLLRIAGTLARVAGELVVSTPKTAKSRRYLHLTEQVERLLKGVRAGQAADKLRAGSVWSDTGFVFTTETGQPLDPRNALRAITTAVRNHNARCDEADPPRPEDKLPAIGLHSLRHSAASVMLTSGVPLTTVSEVLGHGSAVITASVYSHVAPQAKADALTVLGGALSG